MSVKSALDYYNTSDIQVGDVVILNDSRPLDCEGGRVAEPYTRLRVRGLQVVEPGDISVKLETERESILLTQTVYLRIMLKYHSLQKADSWLATTESLHQRAQKESKVFGKLNLPPQILYVIMFLSWILAAVAIAACVEKIKMLDQQVTLATMAITLLVTTVIFITLFGSTFIISNMVSTMDEALEQATELEEQLRLYRQANPDHKDCTAISDSTDITQGIVQT